MKFGVGQSVPRSEDQNALPHRLLEADGLQGAPEEDLRDRL